jgi:enoyl-CoA hydratase
MTSDLVLITEPGAGVVLVTLSDPDRRNVMTAEMGAALQAGLATLAGRDDVRVAVLTGAGSAFSAGGDLALLEDKSTQAKLGRDQTASMRRFYEAFLSVTRVPFPVLAAVNGHAVGAGACVALACDLAVVADTAKIGFNFVRLGIHPGMGGSWSLPRLVGPQRAAELLYTGRMVTGTEAVAYGMALEAVPAAQVLPRTLALAAEIAAAAPQPVRQLKASLAGAATRTLEQQLDVEASAQAENYRTEDIDEGLRAARGRRAPVFRGEGRTPAPGSGA